jgi:arylsulfatase A-like enzyme
MKHTRLLAFVLVASACSKSPREAPRDSAAPVAPPAPSASAKAEPSGPELERPYNVLLLMVDSMRADMPWNGYERDIAPNLTRLAKESCVTYPNGYALSSYTAKSVVPALVGEYPSAMTRDGYFFTRYPDEQNLFISERAQKAGHRTLAGHAHGYFMPMLGNNQGFDDYRLIPGGVDLRAVESITSEPLTQLAKDMLGDAKNTKLGEKKRFFAYFHYMDPHHTYEKHAGHPDFGKKPRDLYDNEMHYTDKHLADLLEFAKKQPWWKQTAIVITADHGEGFGERGQFRHAYELWESLVKVPLMFCIPGVPARRIEERRGHIDLAPTVADLMGLPAEPAFRGVSLVPELLGKKPEKKRIVVDLPRSDLMDRRRGVIDGDYKIIAFGDDKKWMLFNLAKDPWEATDLSETESAELERMKKIYREESDKIGNTPVVGGAPLKGAPGGQRW